MAIPHMLASGENTAVLTAILNGNVYTAEKTHPRFDDLVSAVTTADENTDLDRIVRLFDAAKGVEDFFERVSERVSISGGHVFFDGEEVNDGLANSILKFINENDPEKAQAYVNFLGNVQNNPNEHSRTQLFDWLSRRDFTITAEGNFLAYKGVRPRSSDSDEYPYESISSGRATVDGQVYNGAIPNGVGAVVEMPRGSVQHDPGVGCHTGLHAGTYAYANDFGRGALLLVEINPRDVVSVPTDCDWQKIRTCRYKVIDVVEQELTESYWGDDLDEDYSEDDPFEGTEEESYGSYNAWY